MARSRHTPAHPRSRRATRPSREARFRARPTSDGEADIQAHHLRGARWIRPARGRAPGDDGAGDGTYTRAPSLRAAPAAQQRTGQPGPAGQRDDAASLRARSTQRQGSERPALGPPTRGSLPDPDPASNPESKLLSAELGRKVKTVFHTLPMRYKETLILATLQGLSYQAICRIQGRSLSSVKTDVYRARLLMSEKMQKYSKP